MTPIEKLGVEISDFLEQNALVWPNSLRQAWDAAKDAELRSAKFGPSHLDGDVPVFLWPNEGEENEA